MGPRNILPVRWPTPAGNRWRNLTCRRLPSFNTGSPQGATGSSCVSLLILFAIFIRLFVPASVCSSSCPFRGSAPAMAIPSPNPDPPPDGYSHFRLHRDRQCSSGRVLSIRGIRASRGDAVPESAAGASGCEAEACLHRSAQARACRATDAALVVSACGSAAAEAAGNLPRTFSRRSRIPIRYYFDLPLIFSASSRHSRESTRICDDSSLLGTGSSALCCIPGSSPLGSLKFRRILM